MNALKNKRTWLGPPMTKRSNNPNIIIVPLIPTIFINIHLFTNIQMTWISRQVSNIPPYTWFVNSWIFTLHFSGQTRQTRVGWKDNFVQLFLSSFSGHCTTLKRSKYVGTYKPFIVSLSILPDTKHKDFPHFIFLTQIFQEL